MQQEVTENPAPQTNVIQAGIPFGRFLLAFVLETTSFDICGRIGGLRKALRILCHPQHVFCEECLCLWFDREKTCPLCRSVAVETLRLWKDGSTSAHFQVY
ncbi:hypothetical protein AB205_0161110 [Aquarana catesbeiana]|uniref:RING-type domain-containing protein n=1 Tax=Aquarana catesbeiana TaxID=8400 RepID=A0A2G9S6A0_AQUCT|nr:hypothetical protein AB205_0161110 [Aquarana catesbeiana]